MVELEQEWIPEYELKWWNEVDEKDYLEKLRAKYDHFQVEKYLHTLPNIVLEVGGGKYGGALHFYHKGAQRVLWDPLARNFDRLPGTFALPGYARDIWIFNDNQVDVIFCIEALDHCQSPEELFESLEELKRVLAPGGYLFFQIPLRLEPIAHHPISLKNVCFQEIKNRFYGMIVSEQYQSGITPNDMYLVINKKYAS